MSKYGVGSGAGGGGTGTPAVTLSTTNNAGAASTAIATDATIAVFDATVPVTQAMGDAAAAGNAAVAARRNHVHGMPALGTTAAAIGTSSGGSAVTPSKSDHVHATGAGTPTTAAFGDAAATGSGPAAAMTDHRHGMPTGLTFSGAGVYNNSNVALNVGAEAVITMDTETFDTDAYHDTGSNTGRLTCPSGKDGYFQWNANIRLSANVQGYIVVRKTKVSGGGGSASGILGLATMTWDSTDSQGEANVSGIIDLKATDYIELKAIVSGACNATTGTQPWFMIARIGS